MKDHANPWKREALKREAKHNLGKPLKEGSKTYP